LSSNAHPANLDGVDETKPVSPQEAMTIRSLHRPDTRLLAALLAALLLAPGCTDHGGRFG